MVDKDIHWQIVDAKHAHQKWAGHAFFLIEGGAIDKDMIPVHSHACEFGKWYHSEGQNYKENKVFQDIGIQHELLHRKYEEIYTILFQERRPTFFQRLLGLSHKVSAEDLAIAHKKYQELTTISQKVINLMDQFLEEIDAAAEQEAKAAAE